jgi:tetratricopeptide (TPR) repeat protein
MRAEQLMPNLQWIEEAAHRQAALEADPLGVETLLQGPQGWRPPPSHAPVELQKALAELLRSTGNTGALLRCLRDQAHALERAHDLSGAMVALAEQERIARKEGYPEELLACLLDQSIVLRRQDDCDAAAARLAEAEALARGTHNVEALQAILGSQADLLATAGDHPSALRRYAEVHEICRYHRLPRNLARSLLASARIYSDVLHDDTMALPLLDEAAKVARRERDLLEDVKQLRSQVLSRHPPPPRRRWPWAR